MKDPLDVNVRNKHKIIMNIFTLNIQNTEYAKIQCDKESRTSFPEKQKCLRKKERERKGEGLVLDIITHGCSVFLWQCVTLEILKESPMSHLMK